jgi:ribose-phosphate pyrophosphokinase
MKILNLTNIDKSDIKYEIYHYPDGQNNLKIITNPYNEKNESVTIKSRLNNFIHLEKIICATKSLRNLGVKEIHLYTPYFLGSRSDRKFEEGSNNYLKDVICPIINSLEFSSVTVLDPHSSTLEACLTNFKEISNQNLVKFAINDILTKI